ncbi:MAG: copper resistance protein NlpE [Bacteroidota bacterium]|nr:copper resistance protein NlpE [Bacteroidota bacterium]
MKKFLLVVTTITIFASCKNTSQNTNPSLNDTSLNNEMIDDGHTAENSLDWAGTYKGIIPAASSSGIDVTLVRSENKTYHKTDVYLDEKDNAFTEKGSFVLSKDGNTIILTDEDGNQQQYKVREGSIVFLDKDGQEITDELAKNYVLTKTP